MEPAEIAQLIGELEERVERLRSLYDQYFMGIERLEPTIPRKDVDRRLYALRREQIRNTGLRFKLETTIQRYNTYQQYWMRIVREIENGTYQRDLGRAAQRFGEGAITAFAKRRQKMFEKGQAKKAEREALRQSQAPPPADDLVGGRPGAPPVEASSESYDVAFDDAEILADEPAPLSLDLGPPAARRPVPAPPRAPVAPIAAPTSTPAVPRPRSPAPPLRRLTAESPGTMREAMPAGALPTPSPLIPAPQRPAPSPATPARPAERPAPPPARAPMPSQPQARPAAPAASTEEGLSATRLRQIYGQYVEAKRKANESTAAITFDKVAANLRETASQLSAKHKGAIDFEVVMKNGKPVLKPVMKG